MSANTEKIGIIAGRGDLPRLLIKACQAQQRDVFVLAFENQTDFETVQGVEHAWSRLGAVGKSLTILREHNVTSLVLAGGVTRPSWLELRPDFKGAEILAKIGAKAFGDDGVLSAVVSLLEKEGFKVLGVQEVLQNTLAMSGVMGAIAPTSADLEDIQRGYEAAKILGAGDVGQGVVVQQGIILAVEAVEGTDAVLERCPEARMRVEGLREGGVLVKVSKPHQEKRIDLPTIGTTTIEKVAKAHLHGIALEANGCIIINPQEVIRLADSLGIFLFGVERAS